jgi:eukaryotic-like serine/threonine-protein kinase
MTDEGPPRPPTGDPADDFRRADTIFDAALDLEPYERAMYVERECDGDPALRDTVLRLLRAHERSADFLSHRAADFAPTLLTSAAEGSDHDDDVELRERVQRLLGDAYILEARVARGGMAIVYRARDVRHERVVAVKVLDPELGAAIDADAGEKRFLAEIRTAARLQHPNLLPLFDSGAGDGLLFYVMPFIEGETLRQRMRRESPLPVDEAVRTALGVAGALEYAHAQGVVHRDLKPENILLHAGQPLVADFGIAFAASNAGSSRVTRAGFHLGTPQYMAPEQMSGDGGVDARADVYALGAVLYEMLTGEPPHMASSAQAVLVKRRSERPTGVRVLRESVPLHVAHAVERALEILPADRFPSAAEFAGALATRPVESDRNGLRLRAGRRIRAGLVLVILTVAVAALLLWPRARDAAEPAPPASFFTVAPIPDAGIGRSPALTPDGERLVYPGSAETQRRVFVRRINELTARPIPNTEGALSAFVSPDGQWVAFLTNDDRLRKVPIDGGPVTDLGSVFRYVDAHWGAGDRIVLMSLRHRGLSWIPAGGGTERQLTRLDVTMGETRHSAPLLLRDGRTVLFTAERGRDGPIPSEGELAVVLLDPTAGEPLGHSLLGVRGRRVVGIVDDWLLYVSPDGSGIMAVRFDAARRRVSGEPVVVLDHEHGGIDEAVLADNGTLLYTRRRNDNAPVLVDSTGAVRPLLGGVSGDFMNPRLSPNGLRLAVQAASPQGVDVLIFDLVAPSPMRLTTSGQAIGPSWMADDERVVFLSGVGGAAAFWAQAAGGHAPAQRIAQGDGIFAGDVGGDGSVLLFQRQVEAVWEIWSAQTDGRGEMKPVVAERFDAFMPALSPDGRWLAYAATATGRGEVFVRPFPGPGVPVQVSENGGTEPAWSRDGRRLHYRGDRRMHVATIVTEPSLAVSDRRTLFTETFDSDMPMPHRNYDVAPDGRFVMIAAAGGHGVETVVGIGWLNELRARLSQVR